MTKHEPGSKEENYFLIAEIKSVYDSAGFVKIKSYSDFEERFLKLKNVFIDVFGGMRKFIVDYAEFINSGIILKFVNFDSDEDVAFLAGKKLYVKSSDLVSLSNEQDTYYIHDLVGCDVFRNDKFVGKITDVIKLPTNDVYVINTINSKEVLLPALKDYIQSVKIEEKKIILVPGETDIYDDED